MIGTRNPPASHSEQAARKNSRDDGMVQVVPYVD